MTERATTARDALATIRAHAEDLMAARTQPYDAGWAMWSAALCGVERSTDGEHCHALWLLWGGLTDWVEIKPEDIGAAERAMRRAAHDWLTVADDESRWRSFFEHWLYDELGYARRPDDPE